MGMQIDDDVSAANARVLDEGEGFVVIAPEPDPGGEHCQWFALRSLDEEGEGGELVLDASAMSWADSLEDYRVFASFDGGDWSRVECAWDGSEERLRWAHPEGVREARFALWEPYSRARRAALHRRMARRRGVEALSIGESLDGEPVRGLRFEGGAQPLWIIARQHPGEVMAEWFAEGMIERLATRSDPVTRALLERATVMVVSCVNVDGAERGFHRANLVGTDLNRAWLDGDDESAPEVVALRDAIEATGVRWFLDVHGDESTHRAFAARDEGNPSYTEALAEHESRYIDQLVKSFDEFDRESGYPLDAPGEADLRCAANYIGERYDCPALTIELPFAGANGGWSSRDARAFGHASLGALLAALDED